MASTAEISASLPNAPSAVLFSNTDASLAAVSSSVHYFDSFDSAEQDASHSATPAPQTANPCTVKKVDAHGEPIPAPKHADILGADCDAAGNPIPLNKRQPTRILGFMPNYRSVAAGSTPPKPGWKYNFKVATRQA